VTVYADGAELVYEFSALARDMERDLESHDALDLARLVELPGQTVTRSATTSILRESIRPDDLSRAEVSGRMRQRIERAYGDVALTVDERDQLLAIAAAPRTPGEEAWKLFWERWDLLQKAHAQELVNDDAFARRKAELIGELRR
ncbi:MAG: hypothetical protein HY342_13100, partial [Candidatus Lambdaproteobacteria bacterium]|nr:hypothetical protein [Candidatus Lambdaproteobacteria bacterium]